MHPRLGASHLPRPKHRSGVTASEWCASDRYAALGAAAAYVALGVVAARLPTAGEGEAFRMVNHESDGAAVLRLPQQLGTPWVPPALAAVGLLSHRPHLGVTAALALPVEKALEVGLKKVVRRRRPAQVDPDADLHDDAPTRGPSYPSGHVAIAFASALLAAPYLPRVSAPGVAGLAGVVSLVRVRQGAHFPLDTAGGALLGWSVASALYAVLGRPAAPRRFGR
ncbi:MAG TPA: phosphatase PAP2 family protein [Nocardioidaceae bacterium]|jgi:undecaprenyl-diphosphatase